MLGIKNYWIYWSLFMFGLVAARLLIGPSEAGRYVWAYVLGIWVPIMIVNLIEQKPLWDRVEVVRSKQEPTGFTQHWASKIRVLIHGDCLGDAEIAKLRGRYLQFLKIVLVSFLIFPLVGIFLG